MLDKFNITVERIRDVAFPEKGHGPDAGFDLFIPRDINVEDYKLHGYGYLIPSGLKMHIPHGWCGIIKDKSSVSQDGWRIGACVVDADYVGEIMIHVIGSKHSNKLLPGKKIVQMLIVPVPQVTLVEGTVDAVTERDDAGFGSTGDGLDEHNES